MTKEKILKEIIKIIDSHISTKHDIYLFGSWAKGTALKTSDLDVAILSTRKIPFSKMAMIINEIEDIQTLRSIDIVDLRAKSKTFRKSVLSYAKKLKYDK